MDWNGATGWWLIAGTLAALELVSGTTFYLLMLSLGAGAAALGAHAGLPFSAQLLLASLVGGAAVSYWHRRQARRPNAPAQANPDVNLDIGQRLEVASWQADGTAEVRYRGAAWQARYIGTPPPQPGAHVIRAVEGSCLLLDAA